MNRHVHILAAVLLLVALSSCSSESHSKPDSAEDIHQDSFASPEDTTSGVGEFLAAIEALPASRSFGVQVQEAGRLLLGKPYVAGLLDRSDHEKLVINIEEFDCVLLVEAALAGARAVSLGRTDADAFAEQIEILRYRAGNLDGYCSRLHYFTDWIYDNDRRGIVEDVTRSIGGVPYTETVNFMSEHRTLYRQIADNDSLFAGILATEDSLEDRRHHYIPQEEIAVAYPGIRAGDVIAITTSVEGLDISHTGIAVVEGEGVGFLHASTSEGVVIAPDLSEYVNGNARQTGIMVARPLPVAQ